MLASATPLILVVSWVGAAASWGGASTSTGASWSGPAEVLATTIRRAVEPAAGVPGTTSTCSVMGYPSTVSWAGCCGGVSPGALTVSLSSPAAAGFRGNTAKLCFPGMVIVMG